MEKGSSVKHHAWIWVDPHDDKVPVKVSKKGYKELEEELTHVKPGADHAVSEMHAVCAAAFHGWRASAPWFAGTYSLSLHGTFHSPGQAW